MARVLYATGVTILGATLGTGFGFAVGMFLMPAPIPRQPLANEWYGLAFCSYMIMSGMGGAFLGLTLGAFRQRITNIAALFSLGLGAIFGYYEPQVLDGLFGHHGPHRFFLHFLSLDEYGGKSIVVFSFACAIFVGLFCGTCLSKHQPAERQSRTKH